MPNADNRTEEKKKPHTKRERQHYEESSNGFFNQRHREKSSFKYCLAANSRNIRQSNQRSPFCSIRQKKNRDDKLTNECYREKEGEKERKQFNKKSNNCDSAIPSSLIQFQRSVFFFVVLRV